MTQLWNSIAQNCNDRYWWYFRVCSILESFEYICQISSKSIHMISSYTVSKLGRFLRHVVEMWIDSWLKGSHWVCVDGVVDEAGCSDRVEGTNPPASAGDRDEGPAAVWDEELSTQHHDSWRDALRQDSHVASAAGIAHKTRQGRRDWLQCRQGRLYLYHQVRLASVPSR